MIVTLINIHGLVENTYDVGATSELVLSLQKDDVATGLRIEGVTENHIKVILLK